MGSQAQPDEWIAVREYLNRNRADLGLVARSLYRPDDREPSGLLTRPEWLPDAPLALDALGLRWAPNGPPPAIDGTGDLTEHLRCSDVPGRHFDTYAETIGGLAPPSVFEDRSTYRLLAADLARYGGTMSCCPARYFDGVNIGEAAAHELASAVASGQPPALSRLPLRAAVGDPLELAYRPALLAISTLTIRFDRANGDARFLLHQRDAARVAHGGGLVHVVPVGVFQPLDSSPASTQADFSVWRGMVREYSEELLGGSEEYVRGEGYPFDYDSWPFYRAMTAGRRQGTVRPYVLGIGVDPLTFATDLLTVAVFDADCFDDLFHDLVVTNSEGAIIGGGESAALPFESETIKQVGRNYRLQPACGAVLSLALKFREHLLGNRRPC